MMKKNLMMIGAACLTAALVLGACQSGPAQGGGAAATPGNLKEMVPVPGGSFLMGGRNGVDDLPSHTVTVSSFLIGKYEVTVGAFREFVEATGYVTTAERGDGGIVSQDGNWERKRAANWKNPVYFKQTDDEPVVLVSWNDAVAYCNWRSGQEGFTPAYTIDGTEVSLVPGADGYRLPTEAEWEYAARGGDGSPRNYTFAGSNMAVAVAWNRSTANFRTHIAGTKAPNELGLYDMSGNVWEYVWDWYAPYSNDAQTDPLGPSSGTYHVIRGGAWDCDENWTSTSRWYDDWYDDVPPASNRGFRLVRSARGE